MKRNPRGRVYNWSDILKKIESDRKHGHSILEAVARWNIALSTYYEWKKREAK